MHTRSAARPWHAATAAIVASGLLAQLVLVSIGALAALGVLVLIFATSNLFWLGDKRLPSSRVRVPDSV